MTEILVRKATIVMLDGTVIVGEFRQPPPLADRFAFERHYKTSYNTILQRIVPKLDEEGKQILDDLGDPVREMSRTDPIPQEWEVFLLYCQLRRQDLVTAKFELWCDQLADIEFAEVEPVDPPDQDQPPG